MLSLSFYNWNIPMPSLANHQSNEFTKMIIMGDSSSGKTCSLALLAKDYKLRILDMDNLLDPLKYFILRDCPDKIDNVDYITLRDTYKATKSGPVIDGIPSAFTEALKILTDWPGQGPPSDWGPGKILVIDPLSRLMLS